LDLTGFGVCFFAKQSFYKIQDIFKAFSDLVGIILSCANEKADN